VQNELGEKIGHAVAGKRLLHSAAKNIRAVLTSASSELYACVVAELIAAEQWDELNDRFYKTLEFGTGGLRGRTIGKIVTKAERGKAKLDERPQFPCVGTNAMNFANVNRATQGLVAYTKLDFFPKPLRTLRRKSPLRTGVMLVCSTGRGQRRNCRSPFVI